MSFILDALKKAESERSRASGPVLVDVHIAPPRRRLPVWAWVLGSVLLANLFVLAWLMLRRPAIEEAGAAAAAASVAPVPVNAPMPRASASTSTSPPAASPSTAHVPIPTTLAPPPGSPTVRTSGATPANLANLPTQRDLQSAGVSLPPLLLNLHVYDPSPASRYVLLNGLRLAEGEFTPDGIKVEAITERGVVLDARGQRFLLPAGG